MLARDRGVASCQGLSRGGSVRVFVCLDLYVLFYRLLVVKVSFL